tara:strand:+ start:1573 stop:1893 length:321 start_codon:yes stop_codon:yes gene_type:complete
MRDYAVTDIPYAVVLHLNEHALRHVDIKMAQDLPVVIQVMDERIDLLKVAVQEIERHGVFAKLGWLLDDQEEIARRPIPAKQDGDGKSLVKCVEEVPTHDEAPRLK